MKYSLLLTEGPHDVVFIGKLLRRSAGLRQEILLDNIATLWRGLVPTEFPFGGDLHKRVPVPSFFQNQDVSVAVHAVTGDTNFASELEDALAQIRLSNLHSVACILDADSTQAPAARFEQLKTELTPHIPHWPDAPGQIHPGPPKTGIYVLPDNTHQGTLEDLLLESAEQSWPDALTHARNFVASATPTLTQADSRELRKPAGPNKAIVASVSTLLKPGKSIQTSIQDNDWALNLPRIAALQTFLHQLTGL